MIHFRFLDQVLRRGVDLGEELQDPGKAAPFLKQCLAWVVVLGGYYGAVMGSYNFLGGGASSWYAAINVLKVPALILCTTFLCFPALYVFGVARGAKIHPTSLLAVIVAGQVVMAVALAALSPLVLFFMTTIHHYGAVKWMHLAVWGMAGLGGLRFLGGLLRKVDPGVAGNRRLLASWMILFGLVGMQMAWMMRPFIGHPDKEFRVFQHPRGNVFLNLAKNVRRVFVQGPRASEPMREAEAQEKRD